MDKKQIMANKISPAEMPVRRRQTARKSTSRLPWVLERLARMQRHRERAAARSSTPEERTSDLSVVSVASTEDTMPQDERAAARSSTPEERTSDMSVVSVSSTENTTLSDEVTGAGANVPVRRLQTARKSTTKLPKILEDFCRRSMKVQVKVKDLKRPAAEIETEESESEEKETE